jgi:hypothetical protein
MAESKDHWGIVKFVGNDGSTRFFRKNLRPHVAPGDSRFSTLAFVNFRYQSRDASDLPQAPERQALDALDDHEAYQLEHDDAAIHVGAVLGSGEKVLVYYVSDIGAFARRVLPVLERHKGFAPSCEFSIDPGWNQYVNFPGDEQPE